ncbi:unnamed protein product [Rotaria sp. Silwood1]|nr:unnamed protein product [Rotaria sp. Silwood1]CAF1630511.1 unnamed protein product [Rotaria sp. Silwood1]CAF3804239.1 unnamed protein product [Rotaria sp. Silwood1]CAF4759465.1 unnamed protein product [Rotaria sp. Silwood1]
MATITFAVAKVDICTKKHTPSEGITESDLARWTAKDQKLSIENFQTNHSLAGDLNGNNRRIENAFVAPAFKAYCEHYPLELSVEDIWVAIAQGVSIHLNENAEKYRELMVSHEGKKTLTLSVDSLQIPDSARPKNGNKSIPAIDWPAAVRQMGNLIRSDMKTDVATLLTSPFSSTTSVEQAVFDCTLMDSVKSYYDFRFSLCCGLPQVTLRGSPEDFQQVINRVNQLRTIFLDFHWWLDALLPHLQQLKSSAEGKPDIDWWQKICHTVGGGSDISMLAGWLADFVPYISDGKGHYKKARRDHHHYTQGLINGIEFSDLSESVTQTDFVLDDNGHEIKMKLIAGFLGISQNENTGALRPCLGWITAVPN